MRVGVRITGNPGWLKDQEWVFILNLSDPTALTHERISHGTGLTHFFPIRAARTNIRSESGSEMAYDDLAK